MVLLLALVSGISAVVGVRSIIGSSRQPEQVEKVTVVVAALPLPPGELIQASALKSREFPKALAPAGVLSKIEDIAGRAAIVPIAPDEPVLDNKLAPKGVLGLAALVPEGMRAIPIQIGNVAAGFSGLIMPKNRVDVLFTSTDIGTDDSTGGGSTTTLLQNVEILAVDRKVYDSGDSKGETSEIRSVILAVTPDQANKLDLAQNKGTLKLSLRNPRDKMEAKTTPAILAELRYHQEKPVEPPPVLDEPEPVAPPPVIEPVRIQFQRGRALSTTSYRAP